MNCKRHELENCPTCEFIDNAMQKNQKLKINPENKITEEMILKAWKLEYIPYYFCQILNNECSIEETIKDIKSLL